MIALLLAVSLWQAGADAGERPAPLITPQATEASVKDGVWIFSTGMADIYSTAIALHRCEASCEEGNPILPTAEARVAFKIASSTIAWFGLRELRKDGHHTWANVLRWSVVALNLGLTANNVSHF